MVEMTIEDDEDTLLQAPSQATAKMTLGDGVTNARRVAVADELEAKYLELKGMIEEHVHAYWGAGGTLAGTTTGPGLTSTPATGHLNIPASSGAPGYSRTPSRRWV